MRVCSVLPLTLERTSAGKPPFAGPLQRHTYLYTQIVCFRVAPSPSIATKPLLRFRYSSLLSQGFRSTPVRSNPVFSVLRFGSILHVCPFQLNDLRPRIRVASHSNPHIYAKPSLSASCFLFLFLRGLLQNQPNKKSSH